MNLVGHEIQDQERIQQRFRTRVSALHSPKREGLRMKGCHSAHREAGSKEYSTLRDVRA
jgi:hypothetical protein